MTLRKLHILGFSSRISIKSLLEYFSSDTTNKMDGSWQLSLEVAHLCSDAGPEATLAKAFLNVSLRISSSLAAYPTVQHKQQHILNAKKIPHQGIFFTHTTTLD